VLPAEPLLLLLLAQEPTQPPLPLQQQPAAQQSPALLAG
jgi:hypothetical protein